MSFISFIKEGAADQSIIDNSALASTHNVKNIGGEGGARLAQYLINDCFGLSSIVLIIWLFVISIKSFYRKIKIKVLDFTLKSAISLVVVSLIVGFFTINLSSHFNWGGYHGKIVNDFIHNFIGQTGAIILCLLLIGIFVILCLSDIIKWLYKIQKIKEQRRQEALVLQQEEVLKEKRVQQMSLLSDDDTSNRENVDDNKEETINNQLSFSEDYDISDEIDNNISEILEEEVLATQEDTYSILEDNEIAEKMTVNVNNIAEADNLDKKPEVYDPTAELSRYKFPSYDLLNQINSKISVDEAEQIENKERIRKTLLDFNIPITSIEATVGPTVTLYEVRPDNGIKISKIRGLVDDIALSLAATGVRIIAPIPGKGTVGIEVANRDPQTVSMRTIITSKKFQENKYELPIALGSTISNEVCMADLSKMPHLLVAGATGQGKSVGLNTIITSLLYSKHPAELKFVLIDPKMVEFSLYSKLEKHYLAKLPDSEEAIITDTQKVVATLNSLCQEMDDRYSLLMKCGARTIKEYNSKFIKFSVNKTTGLSWFYIFEGFFLEGDVAVTRQVSANNSGVRFTNGYSFPVSSFQGTIQAIISLICFLMVLIDYKKGRTIAYCLLFTLLVHNVIAMAVTRMLTAIPGIMTSFVSLFTVTLLSKFYRKEAENSISDYVTGLFNRRKFVTDAEIYVSEKTPFYLANVAVRDFAKIVDSYGLKAGDYVLKVIAERISGRLEKQT